MPEMNAAIPQSTSLAAQRERQRTDTPEEFAIRNQILNIPKSAKAKETVLQLHNSEEAFLLKILNHPGTNQRWTYAQHVTELADIMGETIQEGAAYLEQLKGKPVIIVGNHFGVTKYTLVDNHEENGHRLINTPVDEIQTFPVRAAMFARISQALGTPLRESAVELPGVLGQAQRDCGVIVIPAAGEGRTQMLTNDVKQAIREDGNPAIILYPEGGTTGKKSGKGPYDLESFGAGAFVIAAQTGLPIIPTCSIFNGQTGEFELYVLSPLYISENDLKTEGRIQQIAEEVRLQMQNELDLYKNR